jgi:hypothetical protein
VQCFTDTSQPGQLQEPITTSLSVTDSAAPILYLDTLPSLGRASTGSSILDVIMLQQNGLVSVLSGDLQEMKWRAQLVSTVGANSMIVLCAQAISFYDASKTVLKQRRDIACTIDERSALLAVAFVDAHNASQFEAPAKFGLWLIDSKQRYPVQIPGSVEPLLSHDIPRSEKWLRDSNVQLEFALKASSLSAGFSRGALTYDLKALTPRVLSELCLDRPQLLTTIPLSSSLLAGATAHYVKIYDSKYQSIQSSLDLTRIEPKKKRKRSQSMSGGPVRFIAYFAQLGRILAIRRNDLLAFDVRGASRNDSKKLLERSVQLANCLGLGVLAQSVAPKDRVSDMELGFGTVEWSLLNSKIYSSAVRRQLDQLAQDGNFEEFDSLAMNELQASHTLIGTELDDEAARSPMSTYPVSDTEIGYLISKIFRYSAPAEADIDGRLEIVLPARRVVSWLSHRGFLLRHELEKYLAIGSSPSRTLAIQPGCITQAFLDADRSQVLLNEYLQGCGSSDMNELVETTKALLRRVIQQAEGRTNSISAGIGDLVEGQHASSATNTSPLNTLTSHKMAQSYGIIGRGAEHAPSRCNLALALFSLGEYDMSAVSAKLRSSFNTSEILSLIQFLRQELFHGGYTFSSQQRPYPSPAPSDSDCLADPMSLPREEELLLDTIVRLLSSCIDAVGPVGFFTQGDYDDFIENMIPDLRSEIVRATEAMEEASYLRGILRETIRYADSANQRKGENERYPVMGDETISPQKPGTIVTLYSEPLVEQGNIEATSGMLPLSLRRDDIVSKTKVRKGGGQILERSAREIHMLQARQKGKYSFERLVL